MTPPGGRSKGQVGVLVVMDTIARGDFKSFSIFDLGDLGHEIKPNEVLGQNENFIFWSHWMLWVVGILNLCLFLV